MEPNQHNELRLSGWSKLPEHLRGKIYSLLGWKDRLNMSLVCHKWNEGYGWPPLWENFTFKLTNSQLAMPTSPLTKFARTYGQFFKHVEIFFDRRDCEPFSNIWYSWLMEFLEVLTGNSELVSIEFEHLSDIYWSTECANPAKVIADFLASQHQLERVGFFDCYFIFLDGVEFLRQLARKSGESLRHLRLRGFVNVGRFLGFVSNIPKLSDFLNLETLDIDYSLIFVSMFSRDSLETLKNLKSPALSKIILAYNLAPLNALYNSVREDTFSGLKTADWLFLITLLPNLQVELVIGVRKLSLENLDFLVKPNMPISRLEYMDGNIQSVVKLLDRLLQCQTIDRLVSLHLRMCPPGEDLASPIIRFLPACKKLKVLELLVSDSTNIRDLLKYCLENPPKFLEKLIIHISDISDGEDYRMMQNLLTEYESQFKLLGLNVVVSRL